MSDKNLENNKREPAYLALESLSVLSFLWNVPKISNDSCVQTTLRYWICICISGHHKLIISFQNKLHIFNLLLIMIIGMFHMQYWKSSPLPEKIFNKITTNVTYNMSKYSTIFSFVIVQRQCPCNSSRFSLTYVKLSYFCMLSRVIYLLLLL